MVCLSFSWCIKQWINVIIWTDIVGGPESDIGYLLMKNSHRICKKSKFKRAEPLTKASNNINTYIVIHSVSQKLDNNSVSF